VGVGPPGVAGVIIKVSVMGVLAGAEDGPDRLAPGGTGPPEAAAVAMGRPMEMTVPATATVPAQAEGGQLGNGGVEVLSGRGGPLVGVDAGPEGSGDAAQGVGLLGSLVDDDELTVERLPVKAVDLARQWSPAGHERPSSKWLGVASSVRQNARPHCGPASVLTESTGMW
jgi:hypothetical protein